MKTRLSDLLTIVLPGLLALVIVAETPASDPPLAATISTQTFTFENWAGSPIPVRLAVPGAVSADTPIVIVMHGASRDAPRYFEDWSKAAQALGFIAAVPLFSREDFPGSRSYNLGNMFTDGDGGPPGARRRPRSEWTFSAIEPLFDEIRRRTGSTQQTYVIYGHSAGAQFVHRFMYFVPESRARLFIAANAGWYTLPDRSVAFPYGLGQLDMPADMVRRVLAQPLVLLLGDQDNDPQGRSLRKTPEAEAQGPHRYARGTNMYSTGRRAAAALNADFRWRQVVVPGAAHSNAQMTRAAADIAVGPTDP